MNIDTTNIVIRRPLGVFTSKTSGSIIVTYLPVLRSTSACSCCTACSMSVLQEAESMNIRDYQETRDMAEYPKEPTDAACSTNAKVGPYSYAIWYPQMGGYVSRCVVKLDANGCFDAYIWHDGDFPFDSSDDQLPTVLHHCNPEQFVEFGNTVMKLSEKL